MDLPNFMHSPIDPEKLEQLLAVWSDRLEQFKRIKALSDDSKKAGLPFRLHSKYLSHILGIKEKDLANLRDTETGIPYYKPGKKNCYYDLNDALLRLSRFKFASIKEEKASRNPKPQEAESSHNP